MSVVIRENFNLVPPSREESRIVFDVPLGVAVVGPDAISPAATVSSGQTVSGAVVSSGGTQTVLFGGTAIATHVLTEGSQIVFGVASGAVVSGQTDPFGSRFPGGQIVSSGGVAIGTILDNGGDQIVDSGGRVSATTVSSGGFVSVNSGGSASGVVVGSSGFVELDPGGSASNLTVQSGGVVILSGGRVAGLTLSRGAIEEVPLIFSGQTFSGTTVRVSTFFEPDQQTVYAGGTAIATQVFAQCSQLVYGKARGAVLSGAVDSTGFHFQADQVIYGGGVAEGTVVGAVGDLDVESGGRAADATILSGGIEYVSSGGSASGVMVSSGGVIEIDTGGSASGVTVLSGGTVILAGGAVTGLVLSNGAIEQVPVVNSGQTVSGAIVPQEGEQTVYAGGLAIGTEILSGGEQFVYGSARSTVLSGRALSNGILLDGVQSVFSGGVATGTMVDNLGQMYLSSDGRAIGTTISSGGGAFAGLEGSGGTMIWTIVAGGRLYVASGAVTSATLISDGGIDFVSAGGAAVATTVASGGVLTSIFGTVSNATVVSGGNAYQFAGTMNGATLSGGRLVVVGGTATGVTVDSGGLEFAGNFFNGSAGGTLISSVVNSGGVLATGVHGAVSSAVISGGGVLFDLAGATSDVVLSGGVQIVGGGLPGVPPPNPAPSVVASGTVVSSGGSEFVNSNGSAIGTSVQSGGRIVINGGSVSGLSVSSGGAIDLAALAYSAGASLSFAEDAQNTSGVLTVSNGTGTFTITLLGQYAAAGFHLAQDGGGTVITYAPPTSALVLAAGH